ncbi:helix-turn-helix transcriptional regulator [Paenibacillus sp. GSMTC-2017]|uniref:AraC family transcriptional regulator n=1 Tax=Paenibacillus sp. GSMTC-2017 TaxID=2794350 RepID=UPI0018D6E111|nr:AraC family transcriptional regulator [Paenibacillus sp. GSMTC-2017]MBH5319084.1 helix-turn-helix transcriptional regulator [Paenibacillus sp. GSMTC-2017]
MLTKFEALREPMDMPDPRFPIKMHKSHFEHAGTVVFPHHWHEHLEFIYIETGEAVIECGSTPIMAKPGDLIVINSNELHYGVSLSSDLRYHVLIAHISLLHSQFVDAAETKFIAPITQNRLLLHNHIRGDKATTACMLSLIHELGNREFGYELAIKSELYRLLTLLLRGYVATVLSKDQYAERMKNVERFEPVFRHIDEHCTNELSVEQLSSIAGLSRFHFSRLFKELTGRTVTEYITAARLDKADYLLRNTPLTVSEVATASGFNDIYYFSRTFKKHKKIPPSKLRES